MLSKLYMHTFIQPIPLLEICPTVRIAQRKWCYAQIKRLLTAALPKNKMTGNVPNAYLQETGSINHSTSA